MTRLAERNLETSPSSSCYFLTGCGLQPTNQQAAQIPLVGWQSTVHIISWVVLILVARDFKVSDISQHSPPAILHVCFLHHGWRIETSCFRSMSHISTLHAAALSVFLINELW